MSAEIMITAAMVTEAQAYCPELPASIVRQLLQTGLPFRPESVALCQLLDITNQPDYKIEQMLHAAALTAP